MEGYQWAILLKPLGFVVIMCGIVFPIKWLCWNLIPEGRVRRFLFFSWKV